jgi:WD repeat-containing protein 70
MANIFDSAISDCESEERPGLLPPSFSPPSSHADLAAATEAPVRGGESDECSGAGDEDDEEELRRMRASNRYAAFDRSFSRKALRTQHGRGVAGVEVEVPSGVRAEGSPGVNRDFTCGRPNADANDVDDDDDDDDDVALGPLPPPQLQLPRFPSQSSPPPPPQPLPPPRIDEPHRRPRRAIDPKIINDSSDDDDDDDDEEERGVAEGASMAAPMQKPASARLDRLPLTHGATMGSRHDAHVVALTFDAAGARFVSASADASLKLWDFAAMDRALHSFRTIEEPLGTGPLVSAQFSRTGARLLVAGSLTVSRVLDRDGRPLVESAPGDMYIVDMARTKGHTAQLSSARWLIAEQHFATVAIDGTVRLWDAAVATAPTSVFHGTLPRAKQVQVVKLRNSRGNKTNATALTTMAGSAGGVVSGSSGCLALSCDDGSIKLIDPTAPPGAMLAGQNTSALPVGVESTWLEYAPVSRMLLARSANDTLLVFDLRRFDKPLACFTDLPNAVAQTGVTFMGGADEWFATGTSANRRGGSDYARVVVYDSKRLTKSWETAIDKEAGSVIALAWHPRINQLLYGCADGSVHSMYSPEHSRAGVLQCISKTERRKQHGIVAAGVGEIYAPNSLPMFRDASAPVIAGGCVSGRRRGIADGSRSSGGIAAFEPRRSDIPDPAKSSGTFTKAFMASKVKSTWADEDPREALLKLDKVSRERPVFTSVYQATQPVAVYADKTVAQEEEDELSALNARSKRTRRSGDTGK